VLKRPATAFKISLIDKKARTIPLACAINSLLNFTKRRQAPENFPDRWRPAVRSCASPSCACDHMQVHAQNHAKRRAKKTLIYKIVCFLVIAKVASCEKFFQFINHWAESLLKNVPVSRESVIFFSLWRFRLIAKIPKGGSQTSYTSAISYEKLK